MSISEEVINNGAVHVFTAFYSSPWTLFYETKKMYRSVLVVPWLCSIAVGTAPISLRYPEQKFFEQGPEYITKIPTKFKSSGKSRRELVNRKRRRGSCLKFHAFQEKFSSWTDRRSSETLVYQLTMPYESR